MKESHKNKLIFIHNSLPEYRIQFWRKIKKEYDLEIVVSNRETEKRIYGFEKDCSGLIIHYMDDMTRTSLKKTVLNADAVVLPAADRPRETFVAIAVRKICKKNNIPYFYWNEKWEPSKNNQPLSKKMKNYLQKVMIKTASRGCNCYIASGTKSYEYLRKKGIEDCKIQIAYDSSESPKTNNIVNIRNKYGIPNNACVFLYLGRLVSRKGCDLLIKAFIGMKNNKNNYLLICGSGNQEVILHEKALGYSNIIFCGKVQPNERRSFYEQSDYFVLPSIIENGVVEAWGLTLNEALECGTPIISTTAVGAAYDLINDDVGVVVPAGDEEKLRYALGDIMKKSIDREKCRARYRGFSVDKMAMDFCKIVDGRKE